MIAHAHITTLIGALIMAISHPPNARPSPVEISAHPELILASSQSWGSLGVNTCTYAHGTEPLPLRIGAKTYATGLGHHATGEILIDLDGRFERFEAEAGVQPLGQNEGSVVFQVFVDGKKRFDSGVLRPGDAPARVSVSVKGAVEMRLVSSDAGDGIACDCANWAEARLAPGKTAAAAKTPALDAAPFARVVTWDPARMDGTRSGRTEEFREEDLFLETDVQPSEDGYNAPVYDGKACIGLQWLERRYLRSLSLAFERESPDPAGAEVQGWEGESAWQGRFVPLKGEVRKDGRTWELALDWAQNPAARAGMRKVRWVFPASQPVAIASFSAPMRARTDRTKLTLVAEHARAGEHGEVEVYNGDFLSPAGHGVVREWNLVKPLALEVRYLAPGVWKSDRTVLRLRLPSGSFGVAVDDVIASKCVYVPDAGLFASLDSSKLTLQDHKRRIARKKTVLESVRSMPDQTFAQALEHVHDPIQNNGQMMLSLACDNHKFIVHRDGTLQIESDPVAAEAAVSTLAAYGAQLSPSFGSGSKEKLTRALDDGCWIPIHVTSLEEGGIRYTERAFAAPFGERRGAAHPWLKQRGLGVAEFTVENSGGEPAEAVLKFTVFSAADKGEKAALMKTATGFSATAGDRLILRLDTTDAASLSATSEGGDIVLRGRLRPGEKALVAAYVPGWLESAASDLPCPSTAELAAATRAYWESIIASSAGIGLPDPFLMNVIRASQAHCLIAARNEAGGERIAPWIASVSYGPLESEANSIVRGMGLLGYGDFTRRSLDFFINRYSPAGMLTTGYTLMGTGWHLQALGEHYVLERDDAWLEGAASKVRTVCDWIVRQHEKTKKTLPDGSRRPEFGLAPPGVEADWNAYAYHFCLNGYYYAGLHNAALALAEIGHAGAGDLLRQAAHFRQDILHAYRWAQARTPVLALQDGTWVPGYPSQLHSPGRTGDFFPGEDGNRSWCYDVELGAHHLIQQGVLDAGSHDAAQIMDHMEDVQFLSEGWFDYPAEESRADWFNLGGFSKVQPYYTRNAEVCALRDDVKPFIRSYFNTLSSLLNMENRSLWEHFRNVAAWNKTHETGYFLQQTRFMLAMEHGEELWLAPLVTSNWMRDGMTVSASDLPTRFGPVSYRIASHAAAGYIEATVEAPVRKPPKAVVVRLRHPDGRRMKKALVNGQMTQDFDPVRETVRIPAATGHVTVRADF